MAEMRMGTAEAKFADIIWENEPISSSELAKKSEELLTWKKTTSYTVLKRLCDKGLFQNQKGVVTSLISREKFYELKSEKFVEETFQGSLPAFLAAFTNGKKLSQKESAEIQPIIEKMGEERPWGKYWLSC